MRPQRLQETSAPVSPMYMIQQGAFEKIVRDEEALAVKKDRLLQETGAKNMFDKKALNQADIDEYEIGVKDLNEAKAGFLEHFGIDFAEYVPIQEIDIEVHQDRLHRLEFFYDGKAPKLNRTFVAQKKLQIYRQQHPEDEEIDLHKLEQIELDPST